MKKFLSVAVLAAGLAVASPAQASVAKHALAKVAKAAVAPVAHPKRSLKQVAGSIVFAAESVVDVAHVATTALSKAAAVELKHNPFAVVDEYVGKADAGLEKAELFLFGSSN